jgi:predicted neutral ceramidase superfamily lipid hydrolase
MVDPKYKPIIYFLCSAILFWIAFPILQTYEIYGRPPSLSELVIWIPTYISFVIVLAIITIIMFNMVSLKYKHLIYFLCLAIFSWLTFPILLRTYMFYGRLPSLSELIEWIEWIPNLISTVIILAIITIVFYVKK